MRSAKIDYLYRPEMALLGPNPGNFSWSPQKPRFLRERLIEKGVFENFNEAGDWEPFAKEEFTIAHNADYVNAFFAGERPDCEFNGLRWSEQFADSVRYTSASLYTAIKRALEGPETVRLSPTSGFHHARPDGGAGYCTFSGQVIASVKLYREKKAVGAYVDLDGHFGNSIEDSRAFVGPDLDAAVPKGLNINPSGTHQRYLDDLKKHLAALEAELLAGRIHYVVFCHGADSHEWDQIGGGCNTVEWFECSRMVYKMIKSVDEKLGRPIPLALALFGGYRSDDYDSVLDLHAGDLVECLRILCGRSVVFTPEIKRPR